jgi:hypothetical protein
VSAVETRIGFSVAFDDFSLVGYYDLQLAGKDHRNFLKRVLTQANDEIGLSVHDWVYDGIQDEYPKEWGEALVDIPTNSYVTFRVCFSPELLDSIKRAGGDSLPKDWVTLQPAGSVFGLFSCCIFRISRQQLGTSWLAEHKIALLRERLLGGKRNAGKGVYRTMKQLFDAFDLDHR